MRTAEQRAGHNEGDREAAAAARLSLAKCMNPAVQKAAPPAQPLHFLHLPLGGAPSTQERQRLQGRSFQPAQSWAPGYGQRLTAEDTGYAGPLTGEEKRAAHSRSVGHKATGGTCSLGAAHPHPSGSPQPPPAGGSARLHQRGRNTGPRSSVRTAPARRPRSPTGPGAPPRTTCWSGFSSGCAHGGGPPA